VAEIDIQPYTVWVGTDGPPTGTPRALRVDDGDALTQLGHRELRLLEALLAVAVRRVTAAAAIAQQAEEPKKGGARA
jgi:hypothetical protein